MTPETFEQMISRWRVEFDQNDITPCCHKMCADEAEEMRQRLLKMSERWVRYEKTERAEAKNECAQEQRALIGGE